jgi:hypothetical protein
MGDNKKKIDDLNKGAEKLNQSSKDRSKFLEKENYLLREQLKLQSESLDLSSSLVDSIKEVLGISTKRTTADSNLLKVNKEINKAILNQEKGLSSIDTINKRIAKNQKSIEKGKVLEDSLAKRIGKEGKTKINNLKSELGQIKAKQKLIDEELAKTEKQGGINLDIVDDLQKQMAAHDANVDSMMEGLNSQEKQLAFTQLNNKELKEQNKQREKELELAKKIEKKLGVAGNLAELLGAIPGIGKYASSALAEVTKELEKAVNETGEIPKGFNAGLKVITKMGANIAKAFGPLALAVAAIGMFVKALKDSDKEAGELAKNLGISYKEGLKLSEAARETAREFEGIGSKDVLKAQESLNKYFETGAQFSSEIAGEFAQIQKRTGLSDKAMGTFAKMAMKSGKPIKSILKDVTATVQEQNSQNKLSLSVKDIQEDIVKVSAAIKLQTKGNVKELTKSVIAAKKLGTTLEQVESISSSLLDFESSIQAELEAELLLGKEINLEQARLAALKGETGKVAEEIMKNEAVMNAFATDNVIAQEAAAKAIGLSRDQLAEMVMNQKQLSVLQKAFGTDVKSTSDAQAEYNRLKKEGLLTDAQAAILAEEGLANQMESASIAGRFEEVMLRIQDIFSAIAEPVLAIVDFIIQMVGGAENLAGILVGIATTYGVIKAYQKAQVVWAGIMAAKETVLAAIAGVKAVAEMTAASAMSFGIGIVAIIAGLAAGIAAMNSQKQKAKDVGDIMSPAKGVTQVSTKEGGLFNLSKNDDLIAAPGAAKQMAKKDKVGGGMSDARIIAKLDQLIAATKSGKNITMAGDKVNTGIQNETYNQA